jgi:hypothetical protein
MKGSAGRKHAATESEVNLNTPTVWFPQGRGKVIEVPLQLQFLVVPAHRAFTLKSYEHEKVLAVSFHSPL